MEDNADTEVDVECKYILKVNNDTLDNINVRSFKDGSFKEKIQTQYRQELLIKPLMEKE